MKRSERNNTATLFGGRRFIPLLFALVIALLSPPGLKAEELAKVTDVSLLKEEKFHRVIVEISEKVRFNSYKEGNTHILQLRGVSPEMPYEAPPESPYFKITSVNSEEDVKGTLTTVVLTLSEGVTIKPGVLHKPFRIFFSLYPPKAESEDNKIAGKSGGDGRGDKEEKKEGPTDLEVDRRLKSIEEAIEEERDIEDAEDGGVAMLEANMVAFNSSWRWIYRKKVVEILSRDIIAGDALIPGIFRDTFNLSGDSIESIYKFAQIRLDELKSKGSVKKATILEAMLGVLKGELPPDEVSKVLWSYPESGYDLLGNLIIGYHYEKIGFYPEAIGYYTMILDRLPKGKILSAALIRKGIANYFKGNTMGARKVLKEAVAKGHYKDRARLWYANTVLIRGEVGTSRAMYQYSASDYTLLDDVTLMSIGDLMLLKEELDEAFKIFNILYEKYKLHPLLGPYYLMRMGDVELLAEGAVKATERYQEVKNISYTYTDPATGNVRSEAVAIGSLALGSLNNLTRENPKLLEAVYFFESVIDGDFIGTELAFLSLARTNNRLGKFKRALDLLETFKKRYPTSEERPHVKGIMGRSAYNLIKVHLGGGEYHEAVKVYTKYSDLIGFGKKAETLLRMGRSFSELGLHSDAVGYLNKAIDLGRGAVKEEAMLTLARVLVRQTDYDAAERLIEHFKRAYPRSSSIHEIRRLTQLTYFNKGEYIKTAALGYNFKEPEMVMMAATSNLKIKRYGEAVKIYKVAVDKFKEKFKRDGVKRGYLGLGDTYFRMKRYRDAIESYREAIATMDDLAEGGAPDRNVKDRAWSLYQMAKAYKRLGDERGAEDVLVKLRALKGDPKGEWFDIIYEESSEGLY